MQGKARKIKWVTAVIMALTAMTVAMPAAAAASDTTVYQYKMKDGAGNVVWRSGYVTEAVAKHGYSMPKTQAAAVTPNSAAGNVCWTLSVTALSGIFHSKLYTMNLAKCWGWGYGTVVNPNSFNWVVFHDGVWCCPSTTSDVRYFYNYFPGVPNSGHATKVQMQTECRFFNVFCGYGHPWIHAYAHGDGSLYWSGGVN